MKKMIEHLWMGRWLLNEKSLDKEEMTELIYRFSREVEHSDLNLETLIQELDAQSSELW